MNEKLYSSALSNYKKWADNNKAELESDFKERHALCDEMQSYTKERLQNLTEEEFFNLIAPLWAMRMYNSSLKFEIKAKQFYAASQRVL